MSSLSESTSYNQLNIRLMDMFGRVIIGRILLVKRWGLFLVYVFMSGKKVMFGFYSIKYCLSKWYFRPMKCWHYFNIPHRYISNSTLFSKLWQWQYMNGSYPSPVRNRYPAKYVGGENSSEVLQRAAQPQYF